MRKPTAVVDAWFAGLNLGDIDKTAALFDPKHHSIKNAANPTIAGADAAQRLLEDFFDRTSGRRFHVHEVAYGERMAFAHWTATLTFADGAAVAGCVVEPFTVEIDGVDTFVFNAYGQIVELQILHQTTSVAIAAATHMKEEATA